RLLEPAQEHAHFLRGLHVAAPLGRRDAAAVARGGIGVAAGSSQRLAEQFPSGRVVAVERDGRSSVLDRSLVVTGREITGRQGKTQRRRVAAAREQRLEVAN